MTPQTKPTAGIEFSIHPKASLGMVSLTVASLERQIAFYQQALGFLIYHGRVTRL